MVKTLSDEATLYQSRTDGKLSVPQITQSTGNIKLAESISRDAGVMAAKLQDVSEKLYFTNFESSSRKAINDIYLRNKADPEALTRDFSAAYEGLTKDASPFMQAQLKARFEILTAPHITHATELKTRINTDKLKEQSLTALQLSQNDLEHNATQMLSENSQVAFDASRAAQLSMNTMDKMLSNTDENGVPLFSAEQRVKWRDDTRQSMMLLGLQNWFDEQPDKAVAMKEIAGGGKKFKFFDETGNAVKEIDPLEDMDMATFMKFKRYMGHAHTDQIRQKKEAKAELDVQEFLDGNKLVDPKNKDQRAALNKHFDDKIAPALEGMDKVGKAQAISDFVALTGIIPEHVKHIIRSTTRIGSVEQQIFAADLLDRIAAINPLAIKDIDPEDERYAYMVAELVRGGVYPETAIEQTKLQLDPLKKDFVKQRRDDLRELKVDSKAEIIAALNLPSDGIIWGDKTLSDDPNISDEMRVEYGRILESEYIATGNIDVAKTRAAKSFNHLYAVTNITGSPRVMKYAPEIYYTIKWPGLTNYWMKHQLLESVQGIEEYKDVPYDDIVLASNEVTGLDVSQGDDPGYSVLVRNKDGAFDTITKKDGKPLDFRFDRTRITKQLNDIAEKQKKEKIDVEAEKKKIIKELMSEDEVSDVLDLAKAFDMQREGY